MAPPWRLTAQFLPFIEEPERRLKSGFEHFELSLRHFAGTKSVADVTAELGVAADLRFPNGASAVGAAQSYRRFVCVIYGDSLPSRGHQDDLRGRFHRLDSQSIEKWAKLRDPDAMIDFDAA